ncbi:translation initiation factor IF-2 [Clostridium cellulovorans]|uniref:Translation initiation factor IF-2 n=1 Tax=Clostridium cellulovorans (strain ATCC 35296 / DSM 3052 / OCM 3 / 743B) TaxID=573061 RepID=D9SKN6_CLOC7|nr:translation initiation factor IF-2 [Clostridium cellulovorans]ADL51532.1 translation initiation factor IF-2 [Clostridium cellulovorans 743B]
MSKIRVYELAKELNVQSKDLISLLEEEFGIEVKNHMSVIDDEDAALIKEMLEEQAEDAEANGKKQSIIDEYENDLNESVNVVVKKSKNKGREKDAEGKQLGSEEVIDGSVIEMENTITVKELADKLKQPGTEVIKQLMFLGVMAAINQEVDFATAEKLAAKFNTEVVLKEDQLISDEEEADITEEIDEEEEGENYIKRPPVVTVMGHVDHGKTSLLDAIRKTKVTNSEAGGITQHIGAYMAKVNNELITFLDTPGHEAFTAMRARGAQITDIVILVVAADDGIMPQTAEAINHCKAAGVPMIVAINKMDKPGANPDKVKQELTEYGLVVEDWGGDVICVPVSAKTGENLDTLLEMVLLTAEMEEVIADPSRKAKGTVIEAKLDKARGSVASLLVQNGTLKVGDSIIVGTTYGRIRAMFDHTGKKLKEAGPSVPVEILGLSEVPAAGDKFYVVKDEKTARNMADSRKESQRNDYLSSTRVSLEDLYSQIQEGKVKELGLIVKADVQGSVQALNQSLEKLSTDSVKVRVIHGAVGAISEADVTLAKASSAIILGFNVRPDNNAVAAADRDNVDIKTYRIIYDAIDDVKAAMIGMLEPEYKEVILGTAEVRLVYKISNVGTVAGCYVTNGKIVRNASIRLVRNGIVILESTLSSLKRFKDDAKEVASGYECGLTVEKYNDLKEGDIIEAFTIEEIKPTSL